jgi:PTH1 family peptidyl-tRNA hydrolase
MKKFLVVGLGNIGPEYAETRHNIGFRVADQLVQDLGGSFESQKLGSVAWTKLKGQSIVVLKPNTYMNLSGKSVNYWMQQEKIPLEQVLVITDDIHLHFGTFRIKASGTHGGHNGLRHIQETLNTAQYDRFRFGVGAEFGAGKQVDYVLGQWTAHEQIGLAIRMDSAVEAIKTWALEGSSRAMNRFNGPMPEPGV